MGLRERDRAGTEVSEDTVAPRGAGRLRRLLALAAALGALIAFTTLARPQASPSSRLVIGSERDGGTDAGGDASAPDADDRGRAGGDPEAARPGGEAQALLRPLDPSTLADVPANILAVGPEEWTWPSQGGALLALPDLSGPAAGEIRVVDARTFQPVVRVEVDGSLTDFYGFTPGADALVVQAGGANGQELLRYPLDPEQPVTGVELPAGVVPVGPRAAMLAEGRVAMVVAEPSAEEPVSDRSTVHVLVADLLAERMVVDLPLPGLRANFMYGPLREDASQAVPGFAWDSARERLYVAHADVGRVTVVDLAAGTVVAEAEVGTPVALGDEPGQRWRWAEVSPDGTRLYTAGHESLPASGTITPFGLSVIDTATLSEVGRIEGVDGVQLSPDGRWLLWAVAPNLFDPGPADDVQRVALMDTAQVGLMNLLGDRSAAYPLGFSRDSSHVYLQRDEGGQTVVVAHALPSLAQTGERRLPREAWFDPTVGLLRENG